MRYKTKTLHFFIGTALVSHLIGIGMTLPYVKRVSLKNLQIKSADHGRTTTAALIDAER